MPTNAACSLQWYGDYNGAYPWWAIIYPGGDHSAICVHRFDEYAPSDLNEYDIASKFKFANKAAANQYCLDLSQKTGLRIEAPHSDFLD